MSVFELGVDSVFDVKESETFIAEAIPDTLHLLLS